MEQRSGGPWSGLAWSDGALLSVLRVGEGAEDGLVVASLCAAHDLPASVDCPHAEGQVGPPCDPR